MKKKKKSIALPRRSWQINAVTRVKTSGGKAFPEEVQTGLAESQDEE